MSSQTTTRRIAIVTGASRRRGIGAAICHALATQGIDIFFTYWSAYDQKTYQEWEDGPGALLQSLHAYNIRCACLEIDQAQPDSGSHIMDAVETQLGSPCILINNAAYSASGGYKEIDAQSLDTHYAVNIRGTFLLTVEFARRFSSATSGRIINLISGQAWPMPDELAYASTKGAIEAFTVSLSAALAPKRITVNAVDPGATDTGWMSEEFKQELLCNAPQGRLGQPADAARLIAFLASDAAGWITGQIIHSRGGM